MSNDTLITEYRAIAERARCRYFELRDELEQIRRAMDDAREDFIHARNWADQLEAQADD